MVFTRLHLFLDSEAREAAWNMAMDEALTREVTKPVLRVYRWCGPSLSFGYFGEYAQAAQRWPGRNLVRRWTGGGEVPHRDDFTYSLVVPRSDPFSEVSVGESYRQIHAALAECIPGARLASEDAAANPACFARPVTSDLLVHDQKIAGGAQRRGRFGLLHQGSVQGLALPADLARNLARSLALEAQTFKASPALLVDAARLVAERYGTEQWLKRR